MLRFLDHAHTHTRTHRHTHAVRFLSRSDQLVAEAATDTTHDKHKTQTSMPPAGSEPAIPVIERPQTYALDHIATGAGPLS